MKQVEAKAVFPLFLSVHKHGSIIVLIKKKCWSWLDINPGSVFNVEFIVMFIVWNRGVDYNMMKYLWNIERSETCFFL